jgi:hypothetical protein
MRFLRDIIIYQIIEAHLIMSSAAAFDGIRIPSRAEGIGAEGRFIRYAVSGSAE